MVFTSKSGGSRKSSKKGAVSLSEVDRDLLNEKLGAAKTKGAAGSESVGGLFDALERFGLSSDRVKRLRSAFDDMDVRESVDKAQEYLGEQIENARDYAKDNPGKVIGGAAGVLVGASLLAMAIRRAGGEGKRSKGPTRSTSSGSKKSSGSSKKPTGTSKKSSGSSKRASTKTSSSKKR
jgi:hypothetical protein